MSPRDRAVVLVGHAAVRPGDAAAVLIGLAPGHLAVLGDPDLLPSAPPGLSLRLCPDHRAGDPEWFIANPLADLVFAPGPWRRDACHTARSASGWRRGFCLRGGSGLSRHALATGYAAHVRESGVERLRAICDADPGQADRSLTLDLAAYLVGAGATPLLDPARPGAQPSAAASIGAPVFYVEARQVRSAYPAAVVRRAYHRLWGTWRRFRRLRRCDEAFLVVFCRRGRWVELPIEIDLDGLTIYSTSIDLCGPADRRDRSTAIRFSAARRWI